MSTMILKVRALCGPNVPTVGQLHAACAKASGFVGSKLADLIRLAECEIQHSIQLGKRIA